VAMAEVGNRQICIDLVVLCGHVFKLRHGFPYKCIFCATSKDLHF